MERQQHLQRACTGSFDIIVVGGGITGAGVAWDAALRGLNVCLLERSDFGSGTSSVSSKMVHAGLRYIRMDEDLVEEASVERARMFAAAAHLAKPVEYLIPYYDEAPYFTQESLAQDLAAYDRLASFQNTGPSRVIDLPELRSKLPELRVDGAQDQVIGPFGQLTCGGAYWDGVMDDARITVEVIRSAAMAGATVVNYAEVLEFCHDAQGVVNGVVFRDRAPGGSGGVAEARAAALVMATGAYSDLLLCQGGTHDKNPEPVVRPSKGIHLVLKKQLGGGRAITFGATESILLFAVPFREDYLEMGTTDTDYPVNSYQDLDCIPILEEEIQYNMEYLEFLFPGVYTRDSIVAAFAGVRPLARPPVSPGRELSAEDTSRKHKIWQTDAGLWVIAGGKYTTFRRMAEDLNNQVIDDLLKRDALRLKPQPCDTVGRPYHGGPEGVVTPEDRARWLHNAVHEVQALSGLGPEQSRHLSEAYGSSANELAEMIAREPKLGEPISGVGPWVQAEIAYTVQNEMCVTVDDFLKRRTQLRFVETQGLDALNAVAHKMAGLLGWSPAVTESQIEAYRSNIAESWSP